MKTTRHSLLTSATALLLCFVMLVGTTFAWFTDEVTSSSNVIKTGTLRVELDWAKQKSGPWLNAEFAYNEPIFNYDRWEPGYTEVRYLKVTNEGDLAFKYEMFINPTGDVGPLADVIEVSYDIVSGNEKFSEPTAQNKNGSLKKVGTLAQLINSNKAVGGGVLLPEKAEKDGYYTKEIIVCVAFHMQESAGNEYQDKSIGDSFGINLYATQFDYEKDSFDNSYDDEATWPDKELPFLGNSASVNVDNNNGLLGGSVNTLSDDGLIGLTANENTKLDPNTTKLTLKVSDVDKSEANITLGENEATISLDVHVDGISPDNDVPLEVYIAKALPASLNMGNFILYHVEDGKTVPMNYVTSKDDFAKHNDFTYDPATGDVVLYMARFSEVAMVAEPSKWEGNFDYTWYTNAVAPIDGESVTEYTIANADQLAAFGAIVGGMKKVTGRVDNKYTYSDEVIQDSFSGKTVKLIADINIGDTVSDNGIVFYPIGYWNDEGTYEKSNKAISSGFYSFMGTFDGNGNTISNFYQNTWEMKGDHNWYDATLQYYRDGMGLFGKVYGGTVKNLTVKNFKSDGEITTTGVIAAYADCGATFENISIFDCNPRVYNIGNGGIVGCVGWYAKTGITDESTEEEKVNLKVKFKNITVDNSNKISALWGSYDVACGGIVGQYYPTSGQTSAGKPANAGIHFENCHVSAIMDVYNDVCANYQYYAYRYTGMLIGSVRENETIDGHSYPKMDGITASGCTVHFGDWNDYYYCELVANTTASYTHDHQMSRLDQVASVDVNNMKVTSLKGETTDIPKSGRVNYVVVNGEHATENATCYHFVDGKVWNHSDAGTEIVNGVEVLKEDKQHLYLEFTNLVTGYGWGVTSRGFANLDGVTNLDITTGHEDSVTKFKSTFDNKELTNNKTYKLGDIFTFVNNGVDLKHVALAVGITNADEKNPVSATIVYDRENWENGTITLTGTGEITITIQDYYFCTPTTITVNVTDRQPEEKFDVVMNNGDFLHRVGNVGTVALDKLFKAKDGVTVGTVSVTIEALNGTAASGTYSNNAIQFNGTGVVKVTITDNDYCIPTELILEVVDAYNATKATSAPYQVKDDKGNVLSEHNVVLLNDVSGSFTVYSGKTVYGNGFTVTLPTSYQAKYTAGYVGYITINDGNLDNVRIEGPVYPVMNIYQSQAQNSTTDKEEYFYNSILINGGNCTISNSYISGSRTAICIRGGNNVTIDNTTLSGGAVANMEIAGVNTVTLRNLTTVQTDETDSYGQNVTTHGMGIYVSNGTSKIIIEGELTQRNWVSNAQWNNLVGSYAGFFPKFFTDNAYSDYQKKIDGVTYVNLAMIFACNWNKENLDTTEQANRGDYTIKDGITLEGYTGGVYSVTGKQPTSNDLNQIDYISTGYSPTAPTFIFDNSNNHDEDDENSNADTYCTYSKDTGVLNIGLTGSTKTIDLTGVLIQKNGIEMPYTTYLNGNQINGNSVTINSNDGTRQSLVFKVVSTEAGYDADGNPIDGEIVYTYNITIEIATLAYPGPVWKIEGYTSGTTTYQVGTTNCYYVYYLTTQGYGEAVPIYDGIIINYYDKNGNPVTEDLSNIEHEPKGKGETISLNTDFTYTLSDGSILTMKVTGSYKSGVTGLYCTNYNGKTYVYPSALDTNSNVRPKKTDYDFNVTINYTFTDPNGLSTETISINRYGAKANGSKIPDAQWQTFDPDNGKKQSDTSCLAEGTMITLADGSKKAVEDLRKGDMVMSIDHLTGKIVYRDVIIVVKTAQENYYKNTFVFDDGTELVTINEHGIFDLDLNKYVNIDHFNYTEYLGHSFVSVDSEGNLGVKKLVDVTTVRESGYKYDIVTNGTLNYVAEDTLSVTHVLVDVIDSFDFGADLKYDAEKMQQDIEKYGLYDYSEWEKYCDISVFDQYNIPVMKVGISKGLYTKEYIIGLINTYVLDDSVQIID